MENLIIRFKNNEEMIEIIEERQPLGLFLGMEGDKYIAIDNTEGDAWTEEFFSLRIAIDWLEGNLETREAYELDAQYR